MALGSWKIDSINKRYLEELEERLRDSDKKYIKEMDNKKEMSSIWDN